MTDAELQKKRDRLLKVSIKTPIKEIADIDYYAAVRLVDCGICFNQHEYESRQKSDELSLALCSDSLDCFLCAQNSNETIQSLSSFYKKNPDEILQSFKEVMLKRWNVK